MKSSVVVLSSVLVAFCLCVPLTSHAQVGDDALGLRSYNDFQTAEYCGSCHNDIYQQWQQMMMSQSFTHHWDEIEYYKLALPHAEMEPKVAGVKAGCNGCHAPLAFLAGDIPPKRPSEGSRANEGVTCDLCHSIIRYDGDQPYNFNWYVNPSMVKYGPRIDCDSPDHEVGYSTFLNMTEFCGTCHNEKSPFGAWVKATQIEWTEGPYAKEGVRCQDCHMTKGHMQTSEMGNTYDDARLHLFHGAHDPGKIAGTVELRVHPDVREAKAGQTVTFTVALFNQKAGHKFPTGSVEDRILWLDVNATDAAGNVYHLPVDKKGFEGEEYTIAADVKAYQDMGVPLKIKDFEGVARDGVPVGDRIFRMAYLDPEGRMTIQQWNTASFGPDYRIGPRETKMETYTFELPADVAVGPMTVTAKLNYQKLVGPVGEFLEVPAEEYAIMPVNEHTTDLTIVN